MAALPGGDTVVDLPWSHRHHLHGAFLVTTCKHRDIGLVGWKDRRWTHQDKAPSQRDRKARKAGRTEKAPLSTPWQQAFDPEAGAYYFYDEVAQVTTWEEPADGFVPDATVHYYTAQGLAPPYKRAQVPTSAEASPVPLAAETAATSPRDGAAVADAASRPEPEASNVELALSEPEARAAGDAQERASTPASDGESSCTQQRVPADATCMVSSAAGQQPDAPCTPEPGDAVAAREPAATEAAAVMFAPQRKGELPRDVERYWLARYSLMSRWAHGVRMNATSLFSVTPEVIARHHAQALAHASVVLDAFCGCGGSAIQLAKVVPKVIACDVDRAQLEMAEHNAAVYGVAERIEFWHGDVFEVAKELQVDAVFISPPWGGPTSQSGGDRSDAFDPLTPISGLGKSIQDCLLMATNCLRRPERETPCLHPDAPSGDEAASPARASDAVCRPQVAVFLPRNTSMHGLEQCFAAPALGLEPVCVERNVLNNQLKSLTLYASCDDSCSTAEASTSEQ